jgi:hypothetical protein
MLRSLPRALRLFSSSHASSNSTDPLPSSSNEPEYKEHYQYPGNPSYDEFQAWYKKTYHQEFIQDKVVFKPKDQIEFNRVGELVLYECDTFRVNPIYTSYPHALPLLWVPFAYYLYLENPFEALWNWQSLILASSFLTVIPMSEYYWGLRYHVHRLSLLRGGTVLKVEHGSLQGHRWNTWIYIDEINLLSKDKTIKLPEKGAEYKIVGDDGKLAHDTFIQVENFVDIGRNIQDCILTLKQNAKVHHPEILSAVLRGFEVDTSNFRINTLHTERWFEPTNNI